MSKTGNLDHSDLVGSTSGGKDSFSVSSTLSGEDSHSMGMGSGDSSTVLSVSEGFQGTGSLGSGNSGSVESKSGEVSASSGKLGSSGSSSSKGLGHSLGVCELSGSDGSHSSDVSTPKPQNPLGCIEV